MNGSRAVANAAFVFAVVLTAVVFFFRVLLPGTALFSTDNNIGSEAAVKVLLPFGFSGYWSDDVLLGSGGRIPLNWTMLLLHILPLRIYMNWIHAVDLGLASVLLGWFLRHRGCAWTACAAGALTAFWLGSNLTLVYAGHTSKFATLAFAAATVLCLDRGARPGGSPWMILAGGALGIMFMEQQDLALFFGLFLGAYAIFAFVREQGFRPFILAARMLSCALLALVIAGPTMLSVYGTARSGEPGGAGESAASKWEFSTQWSVPPDETIDLIAPGYTGWRSGEPEGPYWGRTGRSAGWEQTHQGFMNFRLESIYIGAIPVVFALFAVAAALRRRSWLTINGCSERDAGSGAHRADIVFWACVAVISLLLAYGKYLPFYALFYMLPVVNSIRNPNKFLQVFQVALAIVAAYGWDIAVKRQGGTAVMSHPQPCSGGREAG